MYFMVQNLMMQAKWKIEDFFKRVFKENAGAAELIATLVIVGIVLAIALIFRKQIANMVGNLWNTLVKNGDTAEKNAADLVGDWG